MRRVMMLIFSLLIPVAFSGGYMLATANARVTCRLSPHVPRSAQHLQGVCADISSTGITTGLLFGVFGLVVWAIGWAVAWLTFIRSTAS